MATDKALPLHGQPVGLQFITKVIRQAKAKAGMAEELARRIKEGAIPRATSLVQRS